MMIASKTKMSMCNDNVLPLAIMLTVLYANNKPIYSYPTYNSYGGMDKSTVSMLTEALSQVSCQSMIDSKMLDAYADRMANLQVQSMAPMTISFPSQVQIAEEPKLSLIERLDKAIFPVNPIRDWTENQVKQIEEIFRKRLKVLEDI